MHRITSQRLAILILFIGLPAIGWQTGPAAYAAQATDDKTGAARDARFAFPPPVNALEAMRIATYSYDHDLPLNPELKPLDEDDNNQRFHLVYDSVHDQRVTAIVAIPKRFAPPYPAIVLMHGSGGHKDADYIRAISLNLTRQGFATISIDAQYRGERARPGRSGDLQPDSYSFRDAWIQTVIDLRRSVDYMESRSDIDRTKIGYLGFSMGAMLGSVVGGVESRLGCFLLAVPGGGFVNLAKNIDKYPTLREHWPLKLTPDVMQRVQDFANVADPIYFVGRILPRPLLIFVAKHDELIPPESSAMLVEAAHAREGENVKRMETGHVLTPAVIFDVRDFFNAQFGKRIAAKL